MPAHCGVGRRCRRPRGDFADRNRGQLSISSADRPSVLGIQTRTIRSLPNEARNLRRRKRRLLHFIFLSHRVSARCGKGLCLGEGVALTLLDARLLGLSALRRSSLNDTLYYDDASTLTLTPSQAALPSRSLSLNSAFSPWPSTLSNPPPGEAIFAWIKARERWLLVAAFGGELAVLGSMVAMHAWTVWVGRTIDVRSRAGTDQDLQVPDFGLHDQPDIELRPLTRENRRMAGGMASTLVMTDLFAFVPVVGDAEQAGAAQEKHQGTAQHAAEIRPNRSMYRKTVQSKKYKTPPAKGTPRSSRKPTFISQKAAATMAALASTVGTSHAAPGSVRWSNSRKAASSKLTGHSNTSDNGTIAVEDAASDLRPGGSKLPALRHKKTPITPSDITTTASDGTKVLYAELKT